MSKLTTKQRNALPTSAFGGPGRSYPENDRGHAIAAKGRAAQQVAKGNLSASVEKRIDAKANKVLRRKK